jgi:hypothetical protein
MPYCAFCDGELPADLRVGRETLCPLCDGHLHACIQCRFYEPTLSNQCLEPEADYVGDRQKANFCEFFQLAGTREAGKSQGARNDTARGKAPAKSAPDTRASDARARLEALFQKKPDDDEEEED